MGTSDQESTYGKAACRQICATMDSPIDTPPRRPRRVSTVPNYLPSSRRSSISSTTSSRLDSLRESRSPEDFVETLYNHPSVKIIAFTSTLRNPIGSSTSDKDPPPGTLPASSHLERTIAVGQFRIYRAPGSVAFLSCGSALQPIMPKSQCWSIDEANSRFVLQIRRPQYWRIELPVSDPEDAHRAFILREVFDKVLLFEKTECPFQRGFTVQLPERPPSPVKKPWTPVGKQLIATPFSTNLSPPSPSPKALIGSRRARTPSNSLRTTMTKDAETSTDGETDLEASITTFERAGSTEASVVDDDDVVDTHHHQVGTERYIKGDRPRTPDDRSETNALNAPNITKSSIDIDASAPVTKNETEESWQKSVQQPKAVSQAQPKVHKPAIPIRAHSVPEVSMPIRPIVPNSSAEIKIMPMSQYSAPSSAVKPMTQATRGTDIPVGRIRDTKPVPGSSLAQISKSKQAEEVPETLAPKDDDIHGDADDEGTSTLEGSGNAGPINLKKKRMSRMLAGRSGMPPTLRVITSSPPRPVQKAPPAVKASAVQPTPLLPTSKEVSPVGSMDSFHSIQSWHSPTATLPPSPPPSGLNSGSFPFPHNSISLPPQRDISRITPDSDVSFISSPAGATNNADETASPGPLFPVEKSKPTPPSSADEWVQNTAQSLTLAKRSKPRRKRTLSFSISRRGLSPLPPAANLFSSQVRRTPSSRIETVAKLPGAIIGKTVEILLSPPSHLVNLMLRVAAKIAAGEWRGLVFGFDEGGEKIPVQWDYSDGEFSSWGDDDDYTFSMGRFGQMQGFDAHDNNVPRSNVEGGAGDSASEDGDNQSWEVD